MVARLRPVEVGRSPGVHAEVESIGRLDDDRLRVVVGGRVVVEMCGAGPSGGPGKGRNADTLGAMLRTLQLGTRAGSKLCSLLLLASLGAACSEDDAALTEEHGYILLRLTPAEGVTDQWASGTTSFTVSVQYGECLRTFYEDNPTWQGREPDGLPIFEEWQDTLCSLSVPDIADCEVQSISQEFSAVSLMLIRYTPNDVPGLTDAVVPVGPFPTEAMVGCTPIVELQPGGAVGVEDIGERVWEAIAFSSERAVVGQEEIIDVEIGVFF